MNIDIKEVLRLEDELKKTLRESPTSSIGLDAKTNLLKYVQVTTVLGFEEAYDDLFYELIENGGLECLRSIAPARSKDLFQPKVSELQDCDEGDRLEQQLQFYLADAELAKPFLDVLVARVAQDSSKYEVQRVGVKSRESTRRKAIKFCGGDVRKITDMARITAICETPEALEQAFSAIMGSLQPQDVLRVANGFNSDWMPSGYRDVKVNAVVHEHLCEIQLQLREFVALKSDQHAVYEWARDLNVTSEMEPEDMFENISPEVVEEMMHLATEDWHGTRPCLEHLQLAAGQYAQAEKGLKQQLLEAEGAKRGFEDNNGKESRMALLDENANRAALCRALSEQGKYDEADALCMREVENTEKAVGSDHPLLANTLINRALLLQSQGKYEEAEQLYTRAVEVLGVTVGEGHPIYARALSNRAGLLVEQGKYDEADTLFKRTQEILEKVLEWDHPRLATTLNNRAMLLTQQ
ncbi:unnamed protein product, partial [Ectocarpus sp. 12 AP-2014]